jgi:hypothetical protein
LATLSQLNYAADVRCVRLTFVLQALNHNTTPSTINHQRLQGRMGMAAQTATTGSRGGATDADTWTSATTYPLIKLYHCSNQLCSGLYNTKSAVWRIPIDTGALWLKIDYASQSQVFERHASSPELAAEIEDTQARPRQDMKRRGVLFHGRCFHLL